MTQETLPQSIVDYFDGKNEGDFARAASGFAQTAEVKDEGKTHTGRKAIEAWMTETSARYNAKSAVQAMSVEGDLHIVKAQVSGNFPGSPIVLAFRFTLKAGEITRLEIGL